MARDPIRINPDKARGGYRVFYWDSGTVGLGTRRHERTATYDEAMDRAREIRAALAVAAGPVPRSGVTVGEVARDWIAAIQEGATDGTLKAYRRDLNCYIIPTVGALPAGDLSIQAFTRVVDGIEAKRLGTSTLDGAIRTLNALTAWAEPRGLMLEGAWGSDVRRRTVTKSARARLRSTAEGGERGITIGMVPSADDVEALAVGLEARWADRGGVFIRLLASSGLRISEALGLSAGDVNVEACTIAVDRQANRLRAWPAMGPPKGRRSREALVWSTHRDTLAAAVDGADEDGWLFPPFEPASQRWWTNRLTEILAEVRADVGWEEMGWKNHWLRHHYASISTTPKPDGLGVPAPVVQESLGHRSLSVTLDTYTQHVSDPAEVMRRLTGGD